LKSLSLIKNLLLKSSSIILVLLSFAVGWKAKEVSLNIQQLTCADYSTKHAMWVGFISIKNGDIRCFWLEDRYPWRTRQGVPVK
jgi:hypothetical protein